ncbi:MAG: homoserine kinase [Defluviitaleaceae bacterium]|nr:homoserine kinase [Defluviitaleaceae bacterium]
MVKVRVPATSANLGPGLDTLGIALNLYNTITFEKRESGLQITGCPPEFANENNLAYLAFKAVLAEHKCSPALEINGLHIHIDANIPVSKGLGSSAALLAAGAIGADKLYNIGFDRSRLLDICCRIEGHPDNLAPIFYGGLTAVCMKGSEPLIMRFPVSENLRFYALTPDFKTSTQDARKALPENVSLRDAVFNLSRVVMLLRAMETCDPILLGDACEDRLHQPYRKQLIPQYELIRDAALGSGADGFIISGSGSTCMCLSCGKDITEQLTRAVSVFDGGWRVIPLRVDNNGANALSTSAFPLVSLLYH